MAREIGTAEHAGLAGWWREFAFYSVQWEVSDGCQQGNEMVLFTLGEVILCNSVEKRRIGDDS